MAEYHLDCSLAQDVRATLDDFTFAYIETSFWTLTDDDGHSLDYLGLHDLSAEALQAMRDDCETFRRDAGALLDGSNNDQAGHDFWLTRNRHGAGFWDRDPAIYPNDPTGRKLSDIAHGYGECDLYLGDDGNLYLN